jgi:hypothetical protein
MSIDRREFLKASAATLGLMAQSDLDPVSAAAANDVTLKVRVEGLGAAVLHGARGPDIPTEATRVDAVMINNGFSSVVEPRHRPVLFFAPSQVDPAVSQPLFARQSKKPNLFMSERRIEQWQNSLGLKPAEAKKVVPLQLHVGDYHISFKETSGSVKLSAGAINTKCPPLGAEWASLRWLANLQQICGHGTIASDCLSMTPPRSVISRITFRGGSVSCVEPTNCGYAQKLWEFKEGQKKTGVKQAVADAIEYVHAASSFTLVLTPFHGVAGAARSIEIPLKLGDLPAITVTLRNVPTEEMEPMEHVEHFRAYYDLLASGTPYVRATPHHVPAECSGISPCANLATTNDSEPNYCPAGLYFADGGAA